MRVLNSDDAFDKQAALPLYFDFKVSYLVFSFRSSVFVLETPGYLYNVQEGTTDIANNQLLQFTKQSPQGTNTTSLTGIRYLHRLA